MMLFAENLQVETDLRGQLLLRDFGGLQVENLPRLVGHEHTLVRFEGRARGRFFRMAVTILVVAVSVSRFVLVATTSENEEQGNQY